MNAKFSPEIEDCRKLARKWGQEQLIAIALDGRGTVKLVTYGADKQLCSCAWALGQVAFAAVQDKIKQAIFQLDKATGKRPITIEDPPENDNDKTLR